MKKIDRLSKLVSSFQTLEKTLKENVEVAKLYTTDIELQKVIDLAIRIENTVRHVSTHAAGILITKDIIILFNFIITFPFIFVLIKKG